jgi:hypothetical protein
MWAWEGCKEHYRFAALSYLHTGTGYAWSSGASIPINIIIVKYSERFSDVEDNCLVGWTKLFFLHLFLMQLEDVFADLDCFLVDFFGEMRCDSFELVVEPL